MQKSDHARDIALDALARLLPVFGRDFTLEIVATAIPNHPGHFSTSVQYVPRSAMGLAIRAVLEAMLPGEIQQVIKERGLNASKQNIGNGSAGAPGHLDEQRVPGRAPADPGAQVAGDGAGLQTVE